MFNNEHLVAPAPPPVAAQDCPRCQGAGRVSMHLHTDHIGKPVDVHCCIECLCGQQQSDAAWVTEAELTLPDLLDWFSENVRSLFGLEENDRLHTTCFISPITGDVVKDAFRRICVPLGCEIEIRDHV